MAAVNGDPNFTDEELIELRRLWPTPPVGAA